MKGIAGTAGLIFLAAMAGCGGDSNPIIPQQPRYLPSSTPHNVLENVRRAYTRRDSTAYDSLFDAAYIGTSIDNSDPSPTLLTFTKADESLHIRALARSTSIATVYLSFGSNTVRFTDVADTLGWATVQVPNPLLQISDATVDWFISGSETMEFKFRPTTPSAGSQTDTTWHVVRWTEIAN